MCQKVEGVEAGVGKNNMMKVLGMVSLAYGGKLSTDYLTEQA